jgi:5-methylcytosine-specific restriction endonuclease McrA
MVSLTPVAHKTHEAHNKYMRDYMRKRMWERKKQAQQQLGGTCKHCDSSDDLEFDHIDPKSKTMVISKMWTASEVRFQAELRKCQLLCRSCHIIKSALECGKKPARGTHGTLSSYRHCGPPKCEACKEAKRTYAQHKRSERLGTIANVGLALDS